jgi:hypothetical protein
MRTGCLRWLPRETRVASMVVLGALCLSGRVRADDPVNPATAEATDGDAARIAAAGHSLVWTWTPPGTTQRFGHGETLIHAPIAQVRHTVLDFARYKNLGPDIKTSRVVGREPDGSTDVYLRIAILNDMISLWNVTRFAPLRREPSGEIIEGHMLPGKGNIDDSVVKWTLHPAGDEWTVLKFDALLRPSVPAPQSLIDSTLRESAVHTVESVRDQVQGASGIQPYKG